MARVINMNNKRKKCKLCGSLVEYTSEDVRSEEVYYNTTDDKPHTHAVIDCPCCNEIIIIH